LSHWRWRAPGARCAGELVGSEARRFGAYDGDRHHSSATRSGWPAGGVAGARCEVAAIVVEPSTFGGDRSLLEVFAALAVTDVFSYM